jgi:MoxR-like ATPase
MTPDIPSQITLPEAGDCPASVHLFDEPSAWAIRAALAANRPLLVRGEPGVGKSQLARAAAVWLNRPFLSVVVDIRTESHDLMASFDAVRRLAEAQIVAARQADDPDERLAECKFVHPGKLWWAFHWEDARKQAEIVRDSAPTQPSGWKAGDGCVLLIDEIDKAESDVPNGLLEALGSRSFPVRGRSWPVAVVGKPPLVVITTNEDRVLPNAFIRRCLVLHLELPTEERALRDLLVVRGQAHIPHLKPSFLEIAANVVIEARNAARAQHVRPLPGQAEYLDLIRAVSHLAAADESKQHEVLNRVKGFVLNKNAGGNA